MWVQWNESKITQANRKASSLPGGTPHSERTGSVPCRLTTSSCPPYRSLRRPSVTSTDLHRLHKSRGLFLSFKYLQHLYCLLVYVMIIFGAPGMSQTLQSVPETKHIETSGLDFLGTYIWWARLPRWTSTSEDNEYYKGQICLKIMDSCRWNVLPAGICLLELWQCTQ